MWQSHNSIAKASMSQLHLQLKGTENYCGLLEYNHLLVLCLQCQYVVVLPDPLTARRIHGISILIGHHSRALPQCCSNAIWQGDALGEQRNRGRVSIEVCVIAAAHWLGVK